MKSVLIIAFIFPRINSQTVVYIFNTKYCIIWCQQSWGVKRHTELCTSPLPWSHSIRWCLTEGFSNGDQCRSMGLCGLESTWCCLQLQHVYSCVICAVAGTVCSAWVRDLWQQRCQDADHYNPAEHIAWQTHVCWSLWKTDSAPWTG